jgi:hypothetical protein
LCFPPLQQQPQELVSWPPAHGGAPLLGELLATEEANTESFLASLLEPQCGHLVPFHLLERTSTSLSLSQLSQ